MQPKCSNCGSILIPGAYSCWQCGASYSRPGNFEHCDDSLKPQKSNIKNNDAASEQFKDFFTRLDDINSNYNIAYQQEVCDMTEFAFNKSQKNQKTFAIINIVLGVFSLIFAGFILGLFAFLTANKANSYPEPYKRINRAQNFNLIAIAINAAMIVVITFILIFGRNIFISGNIYY